ncbi:MAG: hypothetical protein M1813_001227 [Trichoglossum hirsutum]|nr:MAG: hypothetical protein M1813_001227 [Trichoglossum hirsutum]
MASNKTALLHTPTRLSNQPEVQQLRFQSNQRLRNSFEAIYKKYGKDFAGVGDEIDLETGRIVVDNGHLLEMRDEQDVGQDAEEGTGWLLRDLTKLPGRGCGGSGHSLGARDQEEEEILDAEGWAKHTDEGLVSDGEDAIGRRHTVPQGTRKRKASALEHVGGELTQQVAHHAIQQKSINDTHSELAWRASRLTPPPSGLGSLSCSVSSSRQGISTSPIQRGSIWALPKRRSRAKAKPLGFYRDVLGDPGITREQKWRGSAPLIILSDSEDNLVAGKRNKSQPLSGNRIEPTLAMDLLQSTGGGHSPQGPGYHPMEMLAPRGLTAPHKPRNSHQHSPEGAHWDNRRSRSLRSNPTQSNSRVMCLVSPMKDEEARLYEASNSPRSTIRKGASNNTDLERVLEDFRCRLAPRQQNRKSNNPNESPGDLGSNSLIGSPTLKGEYPSLNKLARDLFFTNSGVPNIGGPYQDPHQASDAAEDSQSMDDYHMDGSGSRSPWGSEGDSESEWEGDPEPQPTHNCRNTPNQKHAEVATEASGSRAGRELGGSRSSSGKTPMILPATTSEQGKPLNICNASFTLPGLPPGTEYVISLMDDGGMPRHSYRLLLGAAIFSAPDRKKTFPQIRMWLREHFAFFRDHTGWEKVVQAALKEKNGFMKAGVCRVSGDNRRGRKYAFSWTIQPESIPHYIKGSEGRCSAYPFKRRFQGVRPIGRQQGTQHTRTRQAGRRPDSRSTPIPSLTKQTEITTKGSQHNQSAQRRNAVNLDSSKSSPTTKGPQFSQPVQKWQADILEFSDAESAGEGPDSNQAIRGRNSEAATEGSGSNTAIRPPDAGVTEPGDTTPEKCQSNNVVD